MAIAEDKLRALYNQGFSVQEIANQLGQKKSTVYYWMRKYEIKTRNRAEAQKEYVKRNGSHQRSGQVHDEDTKMRIGDGLRDFWDSEAGQKNRDLLSGMRKKEWRNKPAGEKEKVLARLRNASRPGPDELSSFGRAFLCFLQAKGESVAAKVKLVGEHLSDLVLERDKIVVEFVLPTDVYGHEAARQTEERYDNLTQKLSAFGYKTLVVVDKSNHVSRARCQRLYEKLVNFRDKNTKDTLTVES